MNLTVAWLTAAVRAHHARPHIRRRRADAGEGVISAAIAVLIMAFLGVAMWIGFNELWGTTRENTRTQVERIGQ
jgi:hypothetical protein